MKYQLDCIVWEFTLKCNLRCSHCGSSAGMPRKSELSTGECFKVCEDLAELGCRDVSLMGGEPFMRDDWFSVGQCAKDLGMDLCFVSNGVQLERYMDKLSRLQPKVVGISLDGMQENHERIRGRGTFDRSVRAIDLLKEKGIQTTIITTVSRINFKDLPAMKDMIIKRDINWQIQVAMPFGNFRKEDMITKEEFYASALFIAKERIKNKFEDLPVVGAHCYGYFSDVLPGSRWNGCSAGKSAMGLTSDGSVVGCLSMGNNRFIEGNVRKESIKDIWNDPDRFAYNRKFDKTKLGPNCIGCKYGERCRGGCNSMSYTTTNKFHNDPYCFYAIEGKG